MSKKKVKVIETKTDSLVSYTGTVTIKKIKNGKVTASRVLHNEGGDELFNYLCNCLTGTYNNNLKPAWAVPAITNSNSIKYATNAIYPIKYAVADRDSNKIPYTEYQFYIPYSDAIKDGFAYLFVYNSDKKPTPNTSENVSEDYSMKLTVKSSDFTLDNEDLLITWQLKFSTKENN
jgi:hypothetical protein